MSAELELAEAAAYASLTETAGLPVLHVAGAACCANPVLRENTMVNHVMGLGVTDPVGDEHLDEIDAFYRAHECRYAVSVSPLASPALADALRERGFVNGYAWMKFERDTEPLEVETSLRIERVEDGRDFGAIIAAAYGMPAQAATMFGDLPRKGGWNCFVAYDGDDAAGAAAMYLHGTTAWLGVAGTAPEHRRKGAQTALLAARIAAGRAEGVHRFTTETGERIPDRPSNSYRNILRAGFEERYVRPNAVAP